MQLSEIEASLSQGNFLGKRQLLIVHISMIMCLIIPLITIILLVIPQVEWDNSIILTMTLANIIFLFLLGVLFYVKIKNNKVKRKIELWMEDCVELIAYAEKIGEYRIGIQSEAVKIRVRFNFGNKQYLRESTANVVGGRKGYLDCYKKYINRKLRILYSPKFDEVLILKNKR